MKTNHPDSKAHVTKLRLALIFMTVAWLLALQPVNAGTWANVAARAPGGVQLMLLLPDGTVMCSDGGNGAWFKLTPNASGGLTSGPFGWVAAPSTIEHMYGHCVCLLQR